MAAKPGSLPAFHHMAIGTDQPVDGLGVGLLQGLVSDFVYMVTPPDKPEMALFTLPLTDPRNKQPEPFHRKNPPV